MTFASARGGEIFLVWMLVTLQLPRNGPVRVVRSFVGDKHLRPERCIERFVRRLWEPPPRSMFQSKSTPPFQSGFVLPVLGKRVVLYQFLEVFELAKLIFNCPF